MLFCFKFHLFVQVLNQTGNEDLCYYNFLCAHPLGLLSGNAPHIFLDTCHIDRQCCGSGSAFILVGWIRIRIRIGNTDPDPNPGG
jgi:hypothetical protein